MAEAHVASPSSWAQAYVGLPYVLGVGECGHRAALVWRQEFGFDIDVAPALGDLRVAQKRIQSEMASPDWCPARHPAEGDAVVMSKGDLIAHVGVWVAPGHVLHCTRRDGTVLTPESDLPSQGFRVVGYFRRRRDERQALAA